jgi:hypothetical protein
LDVKKSGAALWSLALPALCTGVAKVRIVDRGAREFSTARFVRRITRRGWPDAAAAVSYCPRAKPQRAKLNR